MSYKLNIKKTEKDGWRITSKLSYGIGVIYFTSKGEYMSHWPYEETTTKAKYYTADDMPIGVFYCKEDAEKTLEDNTLYYVFEENSRYNYLSVRDQILWNLPTREEALDNFKKNLGEEDKEYFDYLLNDYNHGRLSDACFDYCLEKDIPYGDCLSIYYIPPVTLKNKKHETPITRKTICGLIDHKILNPEITREV